MGGGAQGSAGQGEGTDPAADAINADRRRLPMVRIAKQYAFDGPDGVISLPDLFGPSRPLIVQHVMLSGGVGGAEGPCGRSAWRGSQLPFVNSMNMPPVPDSLLGSDQAMAIPAIWVLNGRKGEWMR